MPITKPPLLTRQEAAAYLGFPKVATLDNLLFAGRGPVRIKLGRLVRFKLDDLDAWVDANRQSKKAAGGVS